MNLTIIASLIMGVIIGGILLLCLVGWVVTTIQDSRYKKWYNSPLQVVKRQQEKLLREAEQHRKEAINQELEALTIQL